MSVLILGVLWRGCTQTESRATPHPTNRHEKTTHNEVDRTFVSRIHKAAVRPLILLFSPILVLIYVRTGAEEVFDALMLSSPTVYGLREAVRVSHFHFPSHFRKRSWRLSCILPSSDFREVQHAKRHHWENLQEMQERVSSPQHLCLKYKFSS